MREITLEELLEAGCHFGHQVTRSNSKARDFIFEARDNIHIIDLAKTKEGLDAAADFINKLAQKEGSNLLIAGTKRQAKPIVEEEVKRGGGSENGLFYVTNRWIGGTLTNFSEVVKNYKKLKDLTLRLQNEEEKSKYTKKEVGLWDRERAKLESFYGGVANMQKVPDALFIIDTHLEDLAVKEAKRMNVTAVGIVDTNADPALIDYPIPANDDAVGSIKLIVSYIMDAWIEGRKTATTEIQKKNETQKLSVPESLSDLVVSKKASGKRKVNKKPATTETQKKIETLKPKRKRKSVSK